MGLAPDRKIWTWFEGEWHQGNVPIMGSADHGTWLGTMVFDGARAFSNVTPDLDLHCARVNHSTIAMGMDEVIETGLPLSPRINLPSVKTPSTSNTASLILAAIVIRVFLSRVFMSRF